MPRRHPQGSPLRPPQPPPPPPHDLGMICSCGRAAAAIFRQCVAFVGPFLPLSAPASAALLAAGSPTPIPSASPPHDLGMICSCGRAAAAIFRQCVAFVGPFLPLSAPASVNSLPFCIAEQVNWNGFPVEIPGTVDMHGRAHPLGVFIKSHEDTTSCLDTLHALSCGVRHSLLVQMPVCRFISDRAWAFLHSDKICLGEEDTEDVHGSCYAHFMRALDKASHVMDSLDSFPALQQDIRAVHDITDEVIGKVSSKDLHLGLRFNPEAVDLY